MLYPVRSSLPDRSGSGSLRPACVPVPFRPHTLAVLHALVVFFPQQQQQQQQRVLLLIESLMYVLRHPNRLFPPRVPSPHSAVSDANPCDTH